VTISGRKDEEMMRRRLHIREVSWALALAGGVAAGAAAVAASSGQAPAAAPKQAAQMPAGVQPPADYLIGPDDVLAVGFWRDKELSVEQVVVRPDGRITLPLINDVVAAGLTPDQLRARVEEAASRFIADPTPTVVVKEIKSRRVFVTGQVAKPGPYPLTSDTTVLQLLSLAGGFSEFAKPNNIVIMRQQGGQTTTLPFRYKDVIKGKKLEQNVLLRPGDTVVVP
jgi:polysaccharide export outer membrane protein